MYLHKEISTYNLENIATNNSPIKRFGVRKFMDQSCKYLTLVKPNLVNGKYSPQSYFDKLTETSVIKAEFGDVPTEWILALIKMFAEVKRSSIICGLRMADSDNTIYSTATPWVFWAFKSQYNISYGSWNLNEPNFNNKTFNPADILLGYGLLKYRLAQKKFAEATKKPVPSPDWVPEDWFSRYGSEVPFEGDLDQEWMPNWKSPLDDMVGLREQFLTHGRTGLPVDETAYSKGTYTSNPLLLSLPGDLFRHMLTQTWIFTPYLRNENSMILSLEDIDVIPEPIVEPPERPINREENGGAPELPW